MAEFLSRLSSYIWPVKTKTLTTAKGQKLEISYENGVKVLNTENANYSFGSLHMVFDKAFKASDIGSIKAGNILVLGLGGGSVIKLLRHKYNIQAPITAVEFDQGVIDIAYEQFGLAEYGNVNCICADAFEYIKTESRQYDLIIDDLYLDMLMPGQSLQSDYIRQIKAAMTPGAHFFKNCMFLQSESKHIFEALLKHEFVSFKSIKASKANLVYALHKTL